MLICLGREQIYFLVQLLLLLDGREEDGTWEGEDGLTRTGVLSATGTGQLPSLGEGEV